MKKSLTFLAALLVVAGAHAQPQTISGATIRAGTTPLTALQAQGAATIVCAPTAASPIACTAAQGRAALGLGTAATSNTGDFDAAGAAATAQAAAIQRANHTGTQLAATISNFSTAADARIAAAVGVSVEAFGAAAAAQAASQPVDATLTALAGANWAANALPIGTGADALSQTSFAANTFPARASTGNLVAKTLTDYGLSLLDDIDASAARTTLGLGTAAVEASGTSGHTLGFLDGTNTWSGVNLFPTGSGIGNGTGNAMLSLDAAAASAALVQGRSAGVLRWQYGKLNNPTESGSDVGSDWGILAYTDAGSVIDTPFRIARQAGGPITFVRPFSMTGNRSFTPATSGGQAISVATATYTDPTTTGSSSTAFGITQFGIPTIAASTPTLTLNGNVSTVTIVGAPVAGAGVVLAAPRALSVTAGSTFLGGGAQLVGTLAVSGAINQSGGGTVLTGGTVDINRSSNSLIRIGDNTNNQPITIGNSANLVSFGAPIQIAGRTLCSPTVPTISSGFGTTPTAPAAGSNTCSFTLTIGSGGTASTGVLTMPAATTGWRCAVNDLTTPGPNDTKVSATTTTSVTLTNYATTTGLAAAWTAGDVLQASCTGY